MSLFPRSRTLSVYGGAGGRGTRVSTAGSLYASPGGFSLAEGLYLSMSVDKKATMQNLNDRLASYLEKVRLLEKTNAELEKKIKDWYESHTDVTFDHTSFLAIIEDLREKIRSISKSNSRTILDIDNAKLAADDFKMKYECELGMRRAIEADITSLKRIQDEMSLSQSNLEMQYEGLKEELIVLKRNHEEEMALASTDARGQMHVSVDAAPSMDLNQAMTEIREHYEALAAKHRKELESWYQSKITTVEQEVVTQNEDLQGSRKELRELTSMLQRLQIDLQSHHSMTESLEGTLQETQARFAAQLAGLQGTVASLEDQLSQVHANITNSKREYDILLDVKTRLEREIAEYRRLLDGEASETHKVVTKTITVVETIVDGRVVESSETEQVDVKNDD